MNTREGPRQARSFAHEVHRDQTRKGKKDVPYVTHLARVVAILKEGGASPEVITAGWLHDVVEDGNTTLEYIEKRWGKGVAQMVKDVTEPDKRLPWIVRKSQAVDHIPHMPKTSLQVKTADVIANTEEMTQDYELKGESIFGALNAPKDQQVLHRKLLVEAISKAWPGNPFLPRLLKAYKSFMQTIDHGM